jgi:hypothetical protein
VQDLQISRDGCLLALPHRREDLGLQQLQVPGLLYHHRHYLVERHHPQLQDVVADLKRLRY